MPVSDMNRRLFSSSSSENDVDDVFRRKGASVVPAGGSAGLGKSRCFSEPTFQNGQALGDSSNVLTRKRGRLFSLESGVETNGSEGRAECPPISEETLQSEDLDNYEDLPEPENSREALKMSPLYDGEEDAMFEMRPRFGRETPLDMLDIATEGVEDNGVFYVDQVGLRGVTTGDAISQNLQDVDDANYPDIERYPSGYCSYATDQMYYNPIYPWDLPKCVRKSTEGMDPMLPDDLFADAAVYPRIDDCEDGVTSVLLPPPPSPSSFLTGGRFN